MKSELQKICEDVNELLATYQSYISPAIIIAIRTNNKTHIKVIFQEIDEQE